MPARTSAATTDSEKPGAIVPQLTHLAVLLATLSIWLIGVRAPLWVDETLAYWQISGGFWKIWTRSGQMPSSFSFLYILWLAKTFLGSQEIALRLPSVLAMAGAAYFLFRTAQELFGRELAFISCIVFCLHAGIVFAATEARPYAFALFMTNCATFALIRWTATNGMRSAVWFGAAAAGILYFQYLFGAILPAFALYYLAVRGRSLRVDGAQIATMMFSFALVSLPQAKRFLQLFQSRHMHIFAGDPHWSVLRQTLVPCTLLLTFCGTLVLAIVHRKLRFSGRDWSLAVLLCPLFGLLPMAILYGISAATPVHVFIPRYCLVAVPGAALTWGLLIGCIDSHPLRKFCCVSFVVMILFQYLTVPLFRHQELSFKQAHEFVNTNVAKDKVPVVVCSAFVESNFEPLPTDLTSENALVSQFSYYPVHAPVILLPFSLNDEAKHVGALAIAAAMQRHERFLAVASSRSYDTLLWLASYSKGAFKAHRLANFEETVVVEFLPPPAGN